MTQTHNLKFSGLRHRSRHSEDEVKTQSINTSHINNNNKKYTQVIQVSPNANAAREIPQQASEGEKKKEDEEEEAQTSKNKNNHTHTKNH